MGYKIDSYFPTLDIEIRDGDVTLNDFFGRTFKGKTNESINVSKFREDKVPWDVRMFKPEGGFVYCISKEGLLSVYLNQPIKEHKFCYELYVMYEINLPDELTMTRNYVTVGYYVEPRKVWCLTMDASNNTLMYIVDQHGKLNPEAGRILLKAPLDIKFDIVETYAFALTRAGLCTEHEYVLRDVNQTENLKLEVAKRW
jgi:hypothetical protein